MTGRWWTEYFRGERLLGRGRGANDLLVLPKTRPGLRQHLTRLFAIGSRAGDNVFHRKIPFPFSRSYLLLESACGRLCPTFSRKESPHVTLPARHSLSLFLVGSVGTTIEY